MCGHDWFCRSLAGHVFVCTCHYYGCSVAAPGMTNGVDHTSSLMKTLNSVKDINFDPELETKEAMDREFHESQSVSDCKWNLKSNNYSMVI